MKKGTHRGGLLQGCILSAVGVGLFFLSDGLWWHLTILIGNAFAWALLHKRILLVYGADEVHESGNQSAVSSVSEIECLPDGLKVHFGKEYESIRGELTQIQGLLHNAIEKLTNDFQSLESDSRQQLKVIENLMTESGKTTDDAVASLSMVV